MARNEKDFVIDGEGRDKGKTYHLREMPSAKAEKWAVRAFIMMSRSGVEIPDDIKEMGLVGLALMGIEALSKVNYSEAEPLLDEMMECITFMPDPGRKNSERRLIEDDIEEVTTRLLLRKAVWGLHVDFMPGVAELKTQARAASGTDAPTPVTPTAQT